MNLFEKHFVKIVIIVNSFEKHFVKIVTIVNSFEKQFVKFYGQSMESKTKFA